MAMESESTSCDVDRQLEQRVKTFLQMHKIPGARVVRVHAQSGVVTLSGVVPSYYLRQLCASACHRVAGVTRLIDRLMVEYREPEVAA